MLHWYDNSKYSLAFRKFSIEQLLEKPFARYKFCKTKS